VDLLYSLDLQFGEDDGITKLKLIYYLGASIDEATGEGVRIYDTEDREPL